MLTAVCFLWRDPAYRYGPIYTAAHVNRWRRGLARHLSVPHECVCVTDIPAGIDPEVRIVPLWDELRAAGGTWVRLRIFAPEMREVLGERILLMDLDGIATGPLDPLLAPRAPFAAMQALAKGHEVNTGFMVFDHAAWTHVWTAFDPARDLPTMKRRDWWEQEWINRCVGAQVRRWDPADGVYAYGRHCLKEFGGRLPPGARYVSFFGPYDPSLEREQARSPWIREFWK